jgi:hypothetical protein
MRPFFSHRSRTSAAGQIQTDYMTFRWLPYVSFFRRLNIRPVSPTCRDLIHERGVLLGTHTFATRRTERVYKPGSADINSHFIQEDHSI